MNRRTGLDVVAVALCLVARGGAALAQGAEAPPAATDESPFGPTDASTWNPAMPIEVGFTIYEVAVGSPEWKDVLESERPVDALWPLVEGGLATLVLGPRCVCRVGQEAATEIRVFQEGKEEITDIGPGEPVVGPENGGPERVYRLRFTAQVTEGRDVSVALSCEVTGVVPVVPEVSAPSVSFAPATQSLRATVTGPAGTAQVVRGLFRFAVDPRDTGLIPAALAPVECFIVVTPSLDATAAPQGLAVQPEAAEEEGPAADGEARMTALGWPIRLNLELDADGRPRTRHGLYQVF